MIKTKKGAVTLRGSVGELMADYMTVSKGVLQMLTDNGFAREDAIAEMENLQEHAFMTDEEIEAEMKRELAKMAKNIARILEEEKQDE
jgi:hypothetical protein